MATTPSIRAQSNWYASNPDVPPGGLGVQLCTSGPNCVNSSFTPVITSSTLGGDDGAFYFPYILDPKTATPMLIGTCRVAWPSQRWRIHRPESEFRYVGLGRLLGK